MSGTITRKNLLNFVTVRSSVFHEVVISAPSINYGFPAYKAYQYFEEVLTEYVRLISDLYYLYECKWTDLIPKFTCKMGLAFRDISSFSH